MHTKLETVAVPLLIIVLSSTGCAHGGSSNSLPGTNIVANQNSINSTAPILGAVSAPQIPSYGAASAPAQLAVPGGPTFNPNGGNLPAPNTVFPALASANPPQWESFPQDIGNNSVTVTVVSATPTSLKFQLSIPALNLGETLEYLTGPFFEKAGLLNYFSDYVWFGDGDTGKQTAFTDVTYAFGYETLLAAMPSSGTASFHGIAQGRMATPSGAGYLNGDSALTADFAAGKISGAFINMTATDGDNVWSWHDVSVIGSIAVGTNKFNGTTAVTSQPAAPASGPPSPFNLNSSAAGQVSGAFYGPSAQSIGGLWTLYDGTSRAVGGFVAKR